MRLSDILKKAAQQTAPPAEKGKPEGAIPRPPIPSPFKPPTAEKSAVQPATPDTPSNNLKAEEVYTRAIIEIKEIIAGMEKGGAGPADIRAISELITLIESRNDEILMLADRATPDIYLYGHCVNVTIFSLLLGEMFGLDGDRMTALGHCAFLHDIGMVKHLPLALKKERFTESELALVRKHPLQGQHFVRQLAGLDGRLRQLVSEVMIQVHNRKHAIPADSSLASDVRDFARIIAVADVYEALTHPRSYRDRFLPHDALKTMINSTERDFDGEMIKAFIERISIYPPGSYVRLNTDELARVVGINRGLPTRPRVRIIADAAKQRPPAVRVIDLSSTPMIFVKEAVDETKLALSDKKLSLELKAVRWWVKGL